MKRFGKAFSNELKKINSKSGHFHEGRLKEGDWEGSFVPNYERVEQTSLTSDWVKIGMLIAVLITFTLMFFRLFHLQIVSGDENRELADSNRIQVKTIHAPRGVIYDRNGKIIANNEPGFRLVSDRGNGEKDIKYISREDALKMEVSSDQNLKNLEVDYIRAYPSLEKSAHILGYVGEINEEELKSEQFHNYKLGDKIGRSGVEQEYEKVLKGIDGGEIVEVDAEGKKGRTLNRKEAIPGQNLYLSIDINLQRRAYEVLEENIKKSPDSCCGAVVAQKPDTGEILAMVSYPSYDPTKLDIALSASNSPILNRVIGGTYPPGSTFKIASGLAGLASGKITPQTTFEDTGVVNLGPFSFANWYFTQYGKKEQGPVDLVRALQRSNDIYFYRLGETIGEEVIGDISRKLGMGKKLGIDLPGEEGGLIPDNGWKEKNTGEIWYPGDTLHMAIGQGFLLTTPLQISNLVSIVAADGKQYPPHLGLKITDGTSDRVVKEFKYEPLSDWKVNNDDLQVVKEGLKQVNKEGGTAWPFFTFPVETAGKTGTAEFGHPKDKTHAWYTAFAPVNNPEIAVTTLIEAGGEGSTNASPIAKEIFRYYFSPDKNNLIKDIGASIASSSAKPEGE